MHWQVYNINFIYLMDDEFYIKKKQPINTNSCLVLRKLCNANYDDFIVFQMIFIPIYLEMILIKFYLSFLLYQISCLWSKFISSSGRMHWYWHQATDPQFPSTYTAWILRNYLLPKNWNRSFSTFNC